MSTTQLAIIVIGAVLCVFLVKDCAKQNPDNPLSPIPHLERQSKQAREKSRVEERDNVFSIKNAYPIQNRIVFYGKEGKQVGELDLEADPPTFTGDVDESARVFFEAVLKQYVEARK